MPVESAADRLAFLSPDEFGDEASYMPAGGAATAGIAGIFDNPSLSIATGDGAAVIDARPTFYCRSADLPAEAQGGGVGDTLLVRGVAYGVANIEPDGTGFALIALAA